VTCSRTIEWSRKDKRSALQLVMMTLDRPTLILTDLVTTTMITTTSGGNFNDCKMMHAEAFSMALGNYS